MQHEYHDNDTMVIIIIYLLLFNIVFIINTYLSPAWLLFD